jgi:hypothetical protein
MLDNFSDRDTYFIHMGDGALVSWHLQRVDKPFSNLTIILAGSKLVHPLRSQGPLSGNLTCSGVTIMIFFFIFFLK